MGLRILNWNVGSLRTQRSTLCHELSDNNYDVICLQETQAKKPLLIPGFNPPFVYESGKTKVGIGNRKNRAGLATDYKTRGLATYVRQELNAKLDKDIGDKNDDLGNGEWLSVVVDTKDGPMTIVNSYVSPTVVMGNLDFNSVTRKTVIVGDFNCTEPNDETTRRTIRHARYQPIQEQVDKERDGTLTPTGTEHRTDISRIPLSSPGGTHISRNGRIETEIDLVFATDDVNGITVETSVPAFYNGDTKATTNPGNYHKFLKITADIEIPTAKEAFQPQPVWARFNREQFNELTEAACEKLLQDDSYELSTCQEKFDHLTTIINEAAKESVPMSKYSQHAWRSWYWDEECKQAKNALNRANRRYRKRPSIENAAILATKAKAYGETVNSKKSKKWSDFWQSIDLEKQPKKGWRKASHALNGGKSYRRVVHTTPEETENIKQMFEDRNDPEKNLPEYIKDYMKDDEDARRQNIEDAKARPCSNDGDRPLSRQELNQILDQAPKDTAPGPDGIPYRLLHALGSNGRDLLFDLIQQSFDLGQLLEDWKLAEIIAIPKKDPGEWRPISLLLCISKIAEKLVRSRLLEVRGPWHQNLFGFIEGRGCQDPLGILREIASASIRTDGGIAGYNHTKKSLCIFWDFEKAFELASPDVILDLLAKKGVGGKLLCWLEDYLMDRKAYVKNGNCKSTLFTPKAGTPQGSILSPTLFNMLVEAVLEHMDLVKTDYMKADLRLHPTTFFGSYADDMMTVIHLELKDLLPEARKAIHAFEETCCILGLKIHPGKSKWMTLGLYQHA